MSYLSQHPGCGACSTDCDACGAPRIATMEAVRLLTHVAKHPVNVRDCAGCEEVTDLLTEATTP